MYPTCSALPSQFSHFLPLFLVTRVTYDIERQLHRKTKAKAGRVKSYREVPFQVSLPQTLQTPLHDGYGPRCNGSTLTGFFVFLTSVFMDKRKERHHISGLTQRRTSHPQTSRATETLDTFLTGKLPTTMNDPFTGTLPNDAALTRGATPLNAAWSEEEGGSDAHSDYCVFMEELNKLQEAARERKRSLAHVRQMHEALELELREVERVTLHTALRRCKSEGQLLEQREEHALYESRRTNLLSKIAKTQASVSLVKRKRERLQQLRTHSSHVRDREPNPCVSRRRRLLESHVRTLRVVPSHAHALASLEQLAKTCAASTGRAAYPDGLDLTRDERILMDILSSVTPDEGTNR